MLVWLPLSPLWERGLGGEGFLLPHQRLAADHEGDAAGDPVRLPGPRLVDVVALVARAPEELDAGARVDLRVERPQRLVVGQAPGEEGVGEVEDLRLAAEVERQP